jgi:hypothetical protein
MSLKRVLLQDFINDICFLVDKSHKIDISDLTVILESKSLATYFKDNYSFEKIDFNMQSHMYTGESWEMLHSLLEQAYYGYRNSLSFGISNNGLLYLIILANTQLRSELND